MHVSLEWIFERLIFKGRDSRWQTQQGNINRCFPQSGQSQETRLTETIIMDADLQDADLSGAYLHQTVVATTNLTGAYLYKAYFNEAYLNKSRFTNAALAYTTLGSSDLSLAIDLEKISHHGLPP
jgi:uncharacterized protein YjbI with pentapeptide repeats